jgi:2-iminobutanoate/2-iminopropanoate deaminase
VNGNDKRIAQADDCYLGERENGVENRAVSAGGHEREDVRRAPSYSHVVTVSGTGKIVYIAGQLARDIDGNCVGKGDMRAQMEQTFKNLDRCLKAAGATWTDVVKTNTFVTDFDEFQKCGDVRMRYFGVATPTSTTVGVTRLAGPDFMIEIEAVAVVNS